MAFKERYAEFYEAARTGRSGEDLRRLLEGHGHAEQLFLENVWWPAVGSFEYLTPEYEVRDFKDGVRYLDFAYIRPPYRICMKIDGYGPHWRDISRWQYADHLQRQNDLVSDNWKVYRFSYDDLKEKPRRCQLILQQILGRWFGGKLPEFASSLNVMEKELIRMALGSCEPITPSDAADYLQICTKHARSLLRKLLEMQIFVATSGSERIRAYKLNPDFEFIYSL